MVSSLIYEKELFYKPAHTIECKEGTYEAPESRLKLQLLECVIANEPVFIIKLELDLDDMPERYNRIIAYFSHRDRTLAIEKVVVLGKLTADELLLAKHIAIYDEQS